MKKFIIITVIVSLIALQHNCRAYYENVLYVGGEGEGNYTKIQDAINDANFYDKIIVYPRVYSENIIINKSIFLEGLNAIVTGDISISANNVSVSGFLINGSYYGVEIKGNGNYIKNCSIFSKSYGIKIEGKRNLVENSKIFKSNFYGLYLYFSSENNIIRNNEIYRNGCGIYIWKSNGNFLRGNIIENNEEGIMIQGGENNSLILNNISENGKGIHLCCESKNNIFSKNNFIENSMHVYCYGGKNKWEENYWDNLSGNYFFINDENVDYLPSPFPYSINNSTSKIYIFYPEENATVSGKIILSGMIEKEGKLRVKIDNGEWENASGSFLWYFEIDTNSISDGRHEIHVEFGGDVITRTIYVKNKKPIPSFDLALIVIAIFFLISKNRKNYL